jgi:hypothetical protein
MKRKFYLIFSIVAVASVATYFGFQYFNQATQEPEIVLDFGEEGAEMRRMETKNLSPYAIFGDSSVVLMTEAEEKGIEYLNIPNRKKHSNIDNIQLDMRTGILKMFDKKGILLRQVTLKPEMLTRFLSVDRLAHKYTDLSPYNYVANNPIMNIDPNGDSIAVAQQYREQFNTTLQSVFGERASQFGYSQGGMLVFNGNAKEFSKDERKVLGQLTKVMSSEMVTNIVYETSFEVTNKNGDKLTIQPATAGGEATILASENNLAQNYIVIHPDKEFKGKAFEVLPAFYQEGFNNGARFKEVEMTTSRENRTLHGIGHIIYDGKAQHNVIDFDNATRRINKTINPDGTFTPNPLPKRKYDETHNEKKY